MLEDGEGDYSFDGRRRRLNQEDSKILMEMFSNNPRPNQAERQELADKLGLNYRSIQIWFQNRRAKAKKESNDPALFSSRKLPQKAPKQAENSPVITAGNFKELCLPKYLDIPIKGQQLLSTDDISKNEAIKKFWKRQQQQHEQQGQNDIKEREFKPKPSPAQNKTKKIKTDQYEMLKYKESVESFDMPDLVPFTAISKSNSSSNLKKEDFNTLKFLTQPVKHILNQNNAKTGNFTPRLDTVVTDLDFLFDSSKNLSNSDMFPTEQPTIEHAFTDLFSYLPDFCPEN